MRGGPFRPGAPRGERRRKPESSPRAGAPSELGDVARGALLRTLEGHGIALKLEATEEKTPVTIERSRLEQVLMNLATNARDALLGGGEICISVSLVSADGGASKEVLLKVSDTGVGMDEQTRERIFEPFFSTKPRGRGHGLGLATVFRIVVASGGNIEIRSAPSAGSDFVVRWPLAPGAFGRGGPADALI